MFHFGDGWAPRILQRLGRILVDRLKVPPFLLGYLVLRQSTKYNHKEYLNNAKAEVFFSASEFNFPFPINLFIDECLPADKVFGRSFRGVRKRVVLPVEIVEVKSARIVSYYDCWNNEFSMAIDENLSVLPIRATGFHLGHAKILRSTQPISLDFVVAWIFEAWSGNYFHWLVYHIPKAIFIRSKYPNIKLLLPESNHLESIILKSLKMIGYADDQFVKQSGRYVAVEKLVYLACDQFDPRLICEIPGAFSVYQSDAPKRRIYVSRTNANWRNVVNESEVVDFLSSYGFECISMETLSFDQQIGLMSETAVLVGPHGAGLANMVFSPMGLQVVEFVLPSFPNSDYYSLANCLGHSYGLFMADGVSDEKEPALQDMRISIPRLRDFFERFLFGKLH